MNYQILTYLVYLTLSITTTIWVGRTLFKNGQIFLDNCFPDDLGLAVSLNHLLIVGFYLLNLGFIGCFIRLRDDIDNLQESFEALGPKIGIVFIVLGVLHFFNLAILTKMRRPITPPPFKA